MTPVQARALFSLWHPTSKKSQNRSKMDTKTDPKSHKPPLGHHSQITLCTAHPNCTKIFKNDVQKGPQNDVKIHSKTSQKRTRHPLGPRWLPKLAPDPPKPRFLAPKPRFETLFWSFFAMVCGSFWTPRHGATWCVVSDAPNWVVPVILLPVPDCAMRGVLCPGVLVCGD